jgi:hypothetical protein
VLCDIFVLFVFAGCVGPDGRGGHRFGDICQVGDVVLLC